MAPSKSSKKSSSRGTVLKRKATEESSPSSKKTKVADSSPRDATDDSSKPENNAADEAEFSGFGSDDEEQEEEEQTAAMMKLIDQDQDEDEDHSEEEVAAVTKKFPRVPEHTKPSRKKQDSEETGVIYVGRIPHGFYEHQMREYFSQFGDITRLRLSRSKKTGASKHYAFIEFADQSVAEIVAKTMDSYLLFGHILKVKMVPNDQIHPDLWKGSDRKYKTLPWKRLEARQLEAPRTKEEWEKRSTKESKKRAKLAKKLKAMDYDFKMPALAAPPS